MQLHCQYTMALKILSHNVKGLNSIQKRWIALKDFKRSNADVVLIQETHFRAGGLMKFASKHFPNSYMASDTTSKAGVAILIKKSWPIKIKDRYIDPHGRFVILVCEYFV